MTVGVHHIVSSFQFVHYAVPLFCKNLFLVLKHCIWSHTHPSHSIVSVRKGLSTFPDHSRHTHPRVELINCLSELGSSLNINLPFFDLDV